MAQTQNLKNLKSYIKRLNIFYVSEGVIVSADIQSKSRANLLHYTRIVLDPLNLKVVRASCDCEGYTFKHYCWHIKVLENLAKNELKEEIEKTRWEMLSDHEDVASWG
jgi:hypothetical protein